MHTVKCNKQELLVYGLLWGILFLGEQLTLNMVLGCAVAAVICYLGVSPIWFILAGAAIGLVLTWRAKPGAEEKGGKR